MPGAGVYITPLGPTVNFGYVCVAEQDLIHTSDHQFPGAIAQFFGNIKIEIIIPYTSSDLASDTHSKITWK